MKKRKYLICISLVLGIVIGSVVTGKVREAEKIKTFGSGSMIAMYIQDEDGNYNLSDSKKFPTDGYVLNTEKSSCKNGGVISQNSSTKALSLKVKTSDECTVYFDVVTSANPSADMLITKANDVSVTDYNSGNKKEMFVFDHPEATQTTGWTEEERRDYRYIGNEPNNYITFNDEVWRIIGIFTVETENDTKEQLIKVIRNESIGTLPWNNSEGGNSSNDWSTASLQKMLNGDYYNQSGSYTSKGLSEIARSQIANVKWYLGTIDTEYIDGSTLYLNERKATSGRTINIIQNIGLMYPSDYIYTYANNVNETCYNFGSHCQTSTGGIPENGWLFNTLYYPWTISSWSGNLSNACSIYKNGFVSLGRAVTTGAVIRPNLYLASSVKIISGDGSQGNPYVLE